MVLLGYIRLHEQEMVKQQSSSCHFPCHVVLVLKSRLWFTGCLIHFRLLGYQHWGRLTLCLLLNREYSLSAKFFLAWKLWSHMLSHHKEKTRSTFHIVALVQEKNMYLLQPCLSSIWLTLEVKSKSLQGENAFFCCRTESLALLGPVTELVYTCFSHEIALEKEIC